MGLKSTSTVGCSIPFELSTLCFSCFVSDNKMVKCQLCFDRLELTAVSFVARSIEGFGLEAKFSVSVQIVGGLLQKSETAKHSQAVLCWSGIKGRSV